MCKKHKARIYFDWAGWMHCNGRPIRYCKDAEILQIGIKLGWYK
jgi:hypothetical protein